jgi:peptidoglycan/LPS O-acetylase OafA/YrhL
MSDRSGNLLFVDLIKVIAAQLIVLHHLAFYGPMSDIAKPLAPDTLSWLSEYARMAVQAFLVVGGFLAARSLAPRGTATFTSVWQIATKRYWRLAPPLVAALVICIACSALARTWMSHDSIPAAPTWWQIAAHLALLQDVLGIDALSAGVWYVAIDFQLYVLLSAVLWVGKRVGGSPLFAQRATLLLVIASLYTFNPDPQWDSWALYFAGAYGLGALAYWSLHEQDWLERMAVLIVVVGIALEVTFRERIAVALSVAVLLMIMLRPQVLRRTNQWLNTFWARAVIWLSARSYPLFLVHFAVCLLVNALWVRLDITSPGANLMGMGIAWAASNVAGAALHCLLNRLPRRQIAPTRTA